MHENLKPFRLRLDISYHAGSEILLAEKYLTENDQWQGLPITEKTPGLLLFLYSVLSCQHLFLRNAAQAAGLGLVQTRAELDARFDKSRFRFDFINTRFQVRASNQPDAALREQIYHKMIHCPVSRNLDPDIEHKLELQFATV